MGKQKIDIPKMLSDLKADKASGANELVEKALEIIKTQLELVKNPNDNIKDKILLLAKNIVNSRPSMAPLINSIGYIIQNLEKITVKTIQQRLLEYEKDRITRKKALNIYFNEFLRRFKKCHLKIMLISYSSTIINLLLGNMKYNLEIYVLESRPLFEGRKTAEVLSQYYKTHLIIDAAMGKYITQIDVVLIGVDSILKDGSIINKIGTLPLAILAKTNDVKVYAIADSYKYNIKSHYGYQILIEEKPIKEIYDKGLRTDFLQIHNYYFDITRPHYISGIISNIGILSIQDFLEKVYQDLPIEWFKYFIINKKI